MVRVRTPVLSIGNVAGVLGPLPLAQRPNWHPNLSPDLKAFI